MKNLSLHIFETFYPVLMPWLQNEFHFNTHHFALAKEIYFRSLQTSALFFFYFGMSAQKKSQK